MRRSAAALLGATALLVLAPVLPAQAASPPLTLTDPAGDSVDTRASMDLRSVRVEVKKIRPSDPVQSIVVTIKFSAPPEERLATYAFDAEIDGCGQFSLQYAPGTVLDQVPQQRSAAKIFVCNGRPSSGTETGLELFNPKFSLSKDTMTFSVALDSLPKAAREGKVLSQIEASTQVTEPVFGLMGVKTDTVATDEEFVFA